MGIQSTMEQAFEDAIVEHLSQSGWLTDTGSSAGWDKARALYFPDVLHCGYFPRALPAVKTAFTD